MSIRPTQSPLCVHGAAVYPYSPQMEAEYTLDSNFDDEPFQMSLKRGNELWIPRRLAPDFGQADLRVEGVHVKFADHFVAKHDDQARVVNESRILLAAGQSHIVQAPTGYGKTYVGAAQVAFVGRPALVLTTKEDLIKQWREAFRNVLGLTDDDIGEWRGDVVPQPHQNVCIALVHSVLKGWTRYPQEMFTKWGLVIPDEVHRMGADGFTQAMWWLPAKLRLGLSATPYRKDGKDIVFHSHIGDIAVVGQQETLIPKVIMKHMPWKCPRRIRRDKKLDKDVIERIPHMAGRTMSILKSIVATKQCSLEIAKFTRLAYEKGRVTVVFSDTMEHLQALKKVITLCGVPEKEQGWYVGLDAPKIYTGSKAEKEKQREKAKHAKVIFATYKMFSEGTDIPWLDTAVLASPRGDVNQIVGRIRREYPGKKEPLVFHPVYKDSPVFASYAASALRWYKSIGCKVIVYK